MIEFEADGNVAVITMNRPEARNAVNGAIAGGLEAAVDKLEADDSLWLGILTRDLRMASTAARFGLPERAGELRRSSGSPRGRAGTRPARPPAAAGQPR